MKYTKDEVLSIIIDIIHEKVNKYGHKCDKEQITSESNLITDFGFDSLDMFLLIADCEDYFKKQGCKIKTDINELKFEISTVQQLVDAIYEGLVNPKPEIKKDDGRRINYNWAQSMDVEQIKRNRLKK